MSRGPIPDKPHRRPTVPETVLFAERYYMRPGNRVGGSLHIVLEDGNLEERSIRFCREWAREHADPIGVQLAEWLLQMTPTQRRRVYCRLRSNPSVGL